KWNTQNFYNFIRNPIYYGLERWRYKKVLKSETTGHSRPVRAEDDYVMYRDMPHLAHVSKALWDKANAVIANRCTHNNKKTGRDNPRFGVSLKNDPTRLGPKLKCWICGGTLRRRGPHIDGIYSPALPAVPDIHILTDHLGIKAHLSTQ
ncbi:MAG TPA: recombinase family protein, partial [Phycisphaerae bacterium]|nr:recombinase family protein [Phycisphaerae bacterium]